MRVPEGLQALLHEGILEDVVRPLRSGKEAQVYLVWVDEKLGVAKVYKDVERRSFKNRGSYTEGRKSKNSRDARAIGKSSRHGRSKGEEAWRSVEVETIYRLQAAGVRVPQPYHFVEGILVMELVCDAEGDPAKRLGELQFTPPEAQAIFAQLLREVVRMTAAGVVHGDLSDFNILLSATGPVIIDFPQAVNAAKNQQARALLLRDVDNLQHFVEAFDPNHVRLPYGEEIWAQYESGELRPDYVPTGAYTPDTKAADANAMLSLIDDVNQDEIFRRSLLGRDATGVTSARVAAPRPKARSKRDKP